MWIDVGFLIFLGYGFYFGFSRGIIKTIYSILSILVAILLSFKISPLLIEVFDSSLNLGPTVSFILGFAITFIIIVIVVRFLGKAVEKLLKKVKLNFINKITGGLMMSLLFVVSFAWILWFLNQTSIISEQQRLQSITYERLEPVPNKTREAFNQLKPAFEGFWEKSTEAIEQSKVQATENETIQK